MEFLNYKSNKILLIYRQRVFMKTRNNNSKKSTQEPEADEFITSQKQGK